MQDSAGNQLYPADKALESGWNELTYTAPDVGTITRVGVQVNKSAATSAIVYLDAVDWS